MSSAGYSICIDAVATWAGAFAAGKEVTAVVVFGSTVRGDFNKWSDTDVLVVAEELPDEWRSRMRAAAQRIAGLSTPICRRLIRTLQFGHVA